MRQKLGLAFVLSSFSVFAQGPLVDLTANGARTHAAPRGRALSAPAASPEAAVEGFLRGRGRSQRLLDSLAVVSAARDARSGFTTVRLEQVVEGRQVFGAYAKGRVNGRGELVHLVELLPEPPAALAPLNVPARAALDAAVAHLYGGRRFNFTPAAGNSAALEFASGDSFFYGNAKVTPAALPLAGAAMSEGWLVETWTRRDNQLHETLIGRGGNVVLSQSRTANETYRVFPNHPIASAEADRSGPAPGATTQSPNGWISADGRTAGVQRQWRLSGNNADAYLDRDTTSNTPDAAGAQITSGQFTASQSLTLDPADPTNQQSAIQNLFYTNNVIHDKLYTHGFTEAAGNFQQNNLGRGGFGNDGVLAEAQDGGGTNNANFATPSDGSNPRMQMYLWTLTTPRRDGDLDTDIVYHEYGHGLTWRMIGSMSGCMSGAIGEGASDSVAILMNGDDKVGEYSYNNFTSGIRRYPYTNYPLKYNNLSGTSVHANGELFAAIMWRAREKFLAGGIPVDTLWDYFVQGMNFIPAAPKYENMRDGIVQAAGGLTAHGCLIYRSFAEFGVGQGAAGSCTSGGTWTVTASSTVPTECTTPPPPVTDLSVSQLGAPASANTGATVTIPVTITNTGNQNVTTAIPVSLSATAGSISNPNQSIASLNAGASATVNFFWTAPATAATVSFTATQGVADDNAANNQLTASTTVTVPATITLTVTKTTNRGRRIANLAWSGATSANVDIFRNGGLLVTTANDGAYSDTVPSKATYTYRVCQSGSTTICSADVTVTF